MIGLLVSNITWEIIDTGLIVLLGWLGIPGLAAAIFAGDFVSAMVKQPVTAAVYRRCR
jgi:F0F1-type ATP synthase membrane subunit c/vacuolar-type H+-ATPase subunit K